MIALSIVLSLSLSLAQPVPESLSPAVVVISDLHLGRGLDGDGNVDPKEDFRWGSEFVAFLDSLKGVTGASTDLVIAGDLFELWEGGDGLCLGSPKPDLGCTEGEALQRIDRAISQHGLELEALQAFASIHGNRLVILPGNHDAALMFPNVEKSLLRKVHSATLRKAGYWISDDNRVLVEHGHMIDNDPNRLDGWPTPFESFEFQSYLKRPWGESFVVQYYDPWEIDFPIVDNISGTFTGAKMAMQAVGVPQGLKATGDFFRFFFGVSPHQFWQSLDNKKGPMWDIQALRNGGDKALADALPPNDPMAELLRQGKFAEVLRDSGQEAVIDAFKEDSDLMALCDREWINRNGHDTPKDQIKDPCPRVPQLGAAAGRLLNVEDISLENRLKYLKRATSKDFGIYVYGHTHKATAPKLGVATGDWQPKAINAGAWQRIVSPAQIDAYYKRPDGTLLSAEELLKLPLESLPACYTYVLIPAGQGEPELRSWRRSNGVWEHGAGGECASIPITSP